MQIVTRTLTLCLAAAALLSGCGFGSKQDGATSSGPTQAAARKPVNPADAISANMVSAVALNKPAGVPVEVRFEIKDRPQIAQPVDVDLVIVPLSASVDRVSGKVQAEDGLDLVDGADIPPSDRPPEGVPIRHTIKVQPKRDGIFMFTAVLAVDAGGQTSMQTFTMPVIAGTGMPDLPAPGAAAPNGRAGVAGAAPAPGHASAALVAAKPVSAAAAQ
ncbi:MAG TPA: hypothetical protein VKB72_11465 [Steroidobacteraceae bacterium]|nr:hypothetical protein [Steroidobacteraceae bacterium]